MTTRRQAIISVAAVPIALATAELLPRNKSIGDLWLEFIALRVPFVEGKVSLASQSPAEWTSHEGMTHMVAPYVISGPDQWIAQLCIADDIDETMGNNIRATLEREIAAEAPTFPYDISSLDVALDYKTWPLLAQMRYEKEWTAALYGEWEYLEKQKAHEAVDRDFRERRVKYGHKT
jgi:hypothetical protein